MKHLFIPVYTAILLACCNSTTETPTVTSEVYIPSGPAVLVQLHEELGRHDNGEFVTLTFRATVRESLGHHSPAGLPSGWIRSSSMTRIG